MEKSKFSKAVQEGEEKGDDPGDYGKMYEHGTGNNVQNMEWRRNAAVTREQLRR